MLTCTRSAQKAREVIDVFHTALTLLFSYMLVMNQTNLLGAKSIHCVVRCYLNQTRPETEHSSMRYNKVQTGFRLNHRNIRHNIRSNISMGL